MDWNESRETQHKNETGDGKTFLLAPTRDDTTMLPAAARRGSRLNRRSLPTTSNCRPTTSTYRPWY